jgi:acyl-CoA dehydrogenase
VPVDFELSPRLRDYGEQLREWALANIRSVARQADTDHRPPANWRQIFDTCPVPLGKTGAIDQDLPVFDDGERLRHSVQYEMLNYADPWGQNRFGGGLGQVVVNLLGTPEQSRKWYEPVVQHQEKLTGFGLSEPGAGSDTSRIITKAVRDGDSWIINGTKVFCSHGGDAEYIVVFAVTDDEAGTAAFVVERGAPGFDIVKYQEDKLGLRSWLTSQVGFTDCRIPLENRLGWDESGNEIHAGRLGALSVLNRNRPVVGIIAIAIAQAAVDVTKEILHEKRQGFRPDRWTLVQNDLETMEAYLDRGRRLARRAVWLDERNIPNRLESSSAKAAAPPNAERVVRRCVQLLGPDGASTDLLVEKWYRDLKILDIFEGTGQIQRRIISRELERRAAS